MTGTQTELTRQTPTTAIFAQVLSEVINFEVRFRGRRGRHVSDSEFEEFLAEKKQHVAKQLESFAEKYPTLGDVADDRYRSWEELYNAQASNAVRAIIKTPGIIRPLSAESSIKDLSLDFIENSTPPDTGTRLHTQVVHALIGNGAYFEGTIKNLRGVPYNNIGEIVADGTNGKLALKATLGLGTKGVDLLYGFMAERGIGKAPYVGIQ